MRRDESVSWSGRVWVLATTEGSRRLYVASVFGDRFTADPEKAALFGSAQRAFGNLAEQQDPGRSWRVSDLEHLGDGDVSAGVMVLRSLRVFEVEQRYTLGGLAEKPEPPMHLERKSPGLIERTGTVQPPGRP